MEIKKKLAFLFLGILLIGFVSAVAVRDISLNNLKPGESGKVIIEIENVFTETIEDVSLMIDVKETIFTTVGSSEFTVDEIEEDENKRFTFEIKSPNGAELGDYQIPYKLTYFIDGEKRTKEGSFGVRLSSESEIDFDLKTENPVLGMNGKIVLRIINKGFGDINFVSVRVFPDGYSLLSEKQVYVGNVESDDFENVNLDVVFTGSNPKLKAIVEYRDFENNKVLKNVDLPVEIYTKKQAEELGIIENNKNFTYIGAVILLIVIWITYRRIKKRRRLKNNKSN